MDNVTNEFEALFAVEKKDRDEAWQERFLAEFPTQICAGDGKAVSGPDGFPYLQMSLESAARDDQPLKFSFQSVIPQLLESGAGVAFFSQSDSAEWVFTHGDIVNFHLSEKFYSPLLDTKLANSDTEEDIKVLVSQPSEQYLPRETRKVIRSYLESQGAKNVRLQMMDVPRVGEMFRYLVFEFSRSGKTDEDLPLLLQGISWFLPQQYLLLGSNDPNEDRATFVDL
jgi:hypothetical protein